MVKPQALNYITLFQWIDKKFLKFCFQCFEFDAKFWQQEANDVKQYLEEQVGADCPAEVYQQCDELAQRVS